MMKYFENSRKVHLRLKCLLNLWNPLLKADVVYGLDCDIFETLSHYTEKASILNESLVFKRKCGVLRNSRIWKYFGTFSWNACCFDCITSTGNIIKLDRYCA